MKNQFNIPVVLFIFKRSDTVLRIINVLSKIQPQKIYLLSDEGRNEDEKKIVADTRTNVENSINWECEIIKNYALENRGVYKNIGEGAKWVFEREKKAIFLEDDNLPEETFFKYCEELLEKYENNSKILWICGTNYLEKYDSKYSYMFTQHLLPCGWASWKEKFLKYYDGNLLNYRKEQYMSNFISSYKSKRLLKQRKISIEGEIYRKEKFNKYASWDYQMLFSIRSNNMYGISPKYNQIRNIGIDEFSTHGGTSLQMELTKRFCEIPTHKLEFPLIHPDNIEIDEKYEKKITNILLFPLDLRIKMKIVFFIKKILGISKYDSLSESNKYIKLIKRLKKK